MALIDFRCNKCGNKFFEIISSEDANKVKCPKCGSDSTRVYKGKFYGKSSSGEGASGEGGFSGGCSGSCGSCSGCH